MSDNILSKPVDIKYSEPAMTVNFAEFEKVVRSRRSVRVFENEPIPESDVEKALDMALLAPNSSNLQTWEFLWVRSPDLKSKLAEACFSQQAAKTASDLIVCLARPNHWKKHGSQMLETIQQAEKNPPQMVLQYYGKLVPLVYRVGPLNLFGLAKKLLFTVTGFFRPVPRGPCTYSELREWSVKSCALACENLMLAFRALGHDSCPMEGFDEVRVRKLLDLPSDAHVVMIVGAGKRSAKGIYGPQIRFPRSQFIRKF
jgi:nitroreductase